jgi:hypothetical protein
MSDDLDESIVPDPGNPLLRPLEPVELDLLEAIWDPISRETAPWPVWDYVSRVLYQGPEEVHDAVAVLAALPTVPAGPGSGHWAAPYGLVWRSGTGPDVSGQDHVGLTIAGLVRLAERAAPLKGVADQLTGIISSLATAERDIVPDPLREVRAQIRIDRLVDHVIVPAPGLSIPVSAEVVVDLLKHEHAPVGIVHGSQPPEASPTMYLRPYARLSGAEDYLTRIGLMAQRRQRPAPTRRGEELLQTLDYVSYVLSAQPAWKLTGRLVVVHDLATAAALAADVSNQEEFKHRLSALGTVLDGLQTPQPSP